MLRFIITILLVFVITGAVLSQVSKSDSLNRNKYSLTIGNIGFATDSSDIVVGNIPVGELSIFNIEIYNFGKTPVRFTNGKSNKFIKF